MFIRLLIAHAIREVVACTYYDGAYQSIIYELNSKAFHTRQSGRPISEYYGELNTIWDMKCTHCGQKNHTRDAFWRLYGYPEWYLEKKKKGPPKTRTVSIASASTLSSSPSIL
ncbi:hypothetical protein LWI28_014163 [Acer negundo]|uniref:Retrotransposon gag domain-containing protein n=1 Tax=Acer negundo TaxID=4023 RepID=A0AAD5J5E2_ACENE|nr:hypothetical protein LWI28_014163 [Acer negundo]